MNKKTEDKFTLEDLYEAISHIKRVEPTFLGMPEFEQELLEALDKRIKEYIKENNLNIL